MSAGVSVITDDGHLVEMQPEGFKQEIEFQDLLEQHPTCYRAIKLIPSPRGDG
jgi:hypothetical protein